MKSPALSRRNFLVQSATASALVAAVPFTLLAEDKPVKKSILKNKICAFEKPLHFLNNDELAQFIAELGFDGIEATLRPGGRVLPEKVEEDLPRLHEALAKRQLAITLFASSINSVESPHAEKTLRAAARLGVKKYRMDYFHYDLEKPILPQLDVIPQKLEKLAALNRELGLTALYQNHSGKNMVGAPVWDIYNLIKKFNPQEIALAFDIRHATVEGGVAWPINFNLVKSHLGAVFVKDFVWENRKVKNVPLGAGMVDEEFFTMLKQTDFAGPISVHVEYLEGKIDRKLCADAFRQDLKKLKELLD